MKTADLHALEYLSERRNKFQIQSSQLYINANTTDQKQEWKGANVIAIF